MKKYMTKTTIKVSIIIAISSLIGIYGQPFISGNKDAINIIVTVFAILAGFLVAIIAIIGDSINTVPGSWRKAVFEADKIFDRLNLHTLLFQGYLVTLGFIFTTILIKDCAYIKENFSMVIKIIEGFYLFLGSMCFLFSLTLPSNVLNFYREKINNEIERRRKDVGIDG